MESWYKVVTPRKEVREGRSFNPDEFAIALEQVVAGTAPEDYRDPARFFERTVFTRALSDHTGMILRRLSGQTANTAPVLTLITQFGGGKTHTLTALYHMALAGKAASKFEGVPAVLEQAGVSALPKASVGVFVGNAWDPRDGRETPWIDLARQIAGDTGVEALGAAARTTPPGTETIGRVFKAAGRPVLILLDEVLNFLNRHRSMADQFHAFIQNLTVATTGSERCAAVISLPRSQVEMTDWDQQWQEKITKVVRRVAKDLIANDETEIAEVVRRRLFENLGGDRVRKNVAKTFADWCFERRAQLPPEWTAVDTAATEAKAREFLVSRFEACYPFHPATLSVFQRKWQALPQYQQTRGTLAMLAQWISWAQKDGFAQARREPVITLGSAPLDIPEFQSTVLGQLGEPKLLSAINADIAGQHAHARALDADTRGALRDIHRRTATAIFFESSGGQGDKTAHLPELRFALGEPDVDTTSVDNAAMALESKAFYVRKVGSDGFQIRHNPTLKKVVSDRRASLDEESEIRPTMEAAVKTEFERGHSIPLVAFPSEGAEVQDSPRLAIVIMAPGAEWGANGGLRQQIAEWTKKRGSSNRLYPGSLVWCLKKPGRELRDKVESWLAWKRVKREIDDGTLGGDFDRTDRAEMQSKVKDAEEAVKDEVWASYRFVVLTDTQEADGLKVIDLGAGHSSASESLCGRVITALKSQALLNESIGAGYIDRNWPPALKESGAWPLSGLRQSFLNGTLTRLLDPDTVLRTKIVAFVLNGDFGLASGLRQDGGYDRVWYEGMVGPEEVSFEAGVFLLTKTRAKALRRPADTGVTGGTGQGAEATPSPAPVPALVTTPTPSLAGRTTTLRIIGALPSEVWNRVGTKVLPKLKQGTELKLGIEFVVTFDADAAASVRAELLQVLQEVGLADKVRVEET